MEKKIFLKREEIKVGVGSTAKVTTVEDYYQVAETDEDQVELQLLDFSGQPIGPPSVISKEDLKGYTYCPDYFKNRKSPREALLEDHIKVGDRHFEKREFFSAEHEYDKALDIDRDHLRANLGKGKTLFGSGRKEAGKKIFEKLSGIKTLFEKENKHTFNEFGIELRMEGMFDEAVLNYLKALSIDPDDEVLYYNLGRVYYEKGEYDKAVERLSLALKVKSDFREARDFLSMINSARSAGQGQEFSWKNHSNDSE